MRDVCHCLIGLKIKDQPYADYSLPLQSLVCCGCVGPDQVGPHSAWLTEENEIKCTSTLLDDFSLQRNYQKNNVFGHLNTVLIKHKCIL